MEEDSQLRPHCCSLLRHPRHLRVSNHLWTLLLTLGSERCSFDLSLALASNLSLVFFPTESPSSKKKGWVGRVLLGKLEKKYKSKKEKYISKIKKFHLRIRYFRNSSGFPLCTRNRMSRRRCIIKTRQKKHGTKGAQISTNKEMRRQVRSSEWALKRVQQVEDCRISCSG